MPIEKLTQKYVAAIKPPATDSVTYWDSQLPGFGVRVSSKGRKTWVCMYRVLGKVVMESIGTTFTIPKIEVARDMARASMLKARQGIHPVRERKAQEAAQQAEAEAERRTFRWLVEHEEDGIAKGYIPQYAALRQRPNSLEQTRYLLNRAGIALGNKLIRDISKSDITAVLDDIATKRVHPYKGHTGSANPMARAVQTCLNTIFAWADREDLIPSNPMRKIARDRHGRGVARDRVLTDDELRALWECCDRLDWPYAPVTRLLLLCGQRRGQTAGMRWSEINLEQRLWTLPAARTKNGRVHVVPLAGSTRLPCLPPELEQRGRQRPCHPQRSKNGAGFGARRPQPERLPPALSRCRQDSADGLLARLSRKGHPCPIQDKPSPSLLIA